MMVQAAIKDKKSGKNKYGDFDISVFEITGKDSAYRSYHMQVEAYLDWDMRKKPKNASEPRFASWSNYDSIKKTIPYKEGSWDNLDDYLTEPGGALFGTGTSNHGWGLALDLNVRKGKYADMMGQKDFPKTPERKWIADYGGGFGFEGYYEGEVRDKYGYRKLKETWHLSYKEK